MSVSSQHPTRSDQLAVLCGEVASIFRRAWGRGPARTTAYWAGADVLVVLLQDAHTDAEKALCAAGHADAMIEQRRLLHAIVEDELKDSVERVIGRPVRTTLAATRVDPDLSAQIFLLEQLDA